MQWVNSHISYFLPYQVRIDLSPYPLNPRGPIYQGRPLKWRITVYDRQYNILFSTWLNRKPTKAQFAKIDFYKEEQKWFKDRISFYLYNDGCYPNRSKADWQAYSERLYQLTKLPCQYDRNWGPKVLRD